MAVVPPLLSKQSVFACVLETTTGTPVSLTASEGAYNAFDVDVQADVDYAPRQGQSALSYLPGVPGGRKAKVRLRTELFGSGSSPTPSPAWADTLLAAAGFSVAANVYKPVTGSASYATLTMGKFTDGRKLFAAGCTGNLKITGTVGRPVMLDWDFSGVWQAPTATAIIAPTYPTVIPPALLSVTFTIASTAYRIPGFEIDLGNVVTYRQDVTNAAGYHSTVITDRKPVLRLAPESLAIGTKDWFADMLAGTTAAVSIAVGGSAGNICTIAAPVAQLMQGPQQQDRDGVLVDDLTFALCRSAAAGDDELSLTWS